MTYHAKRTRREDATSHAFTFHGTGGTEDQFHDFAATLLPNANVTSPRGDVSEAGALRYFRRTAEGVYDMDDLATRRDAMAKFIGNEAAQSGETIGLGYSNGANIAAAVALEHPDVFTRLVLLHPLIPWTPAPMPALQNLRVLITAGRRDPICPAPMTQDFADYLQNQGTQVTLQWHDGGHEIAQSEIGAIKTFLT